ncbi:ankyrin [Gonapodya prolifera JEL478]|uniref:Ankyrin n=1 Tax=Gonapodya prolifera (strain JEL478) TaxID=1344416 RepID=A0A139A6N6_GONPJ|nr:ankyrin [Gonapodya prolifera JEL478]|eukprot:KXS12115.1 ankyrin [Gonapodya prolifera JEL478]
MHPRRASAPCAIRRFALMRLPLDVLLVVSHHMYHHPLALPPGAHSRTTLALFSRPLDIAIRAVSAFGWSASLVALFRARTPSNLAAQALRFILTRAGDLASCVPPLESETGSLWWWNALQSVEESELADVLLEFSPRKYVEGKFHATLLRACELGVSVSAMRATLDKGSKHLSPAVLSDQSRWEMYTHSPLYTAANGGHVGIVQLLLNYHTREGTVTSTTTLLYPPTAVHELMLHSALTNNVTAMCTFLSAGVDPNSASEDGKTALMEGAWNERVDVMQVLLEHGADVNRQDAFGTTALMYAVGPLAPFEFGKRMPSFEGSSLWNAHVVHTLLCTGADPTLCNAEGRTALMLACAHRNVHTLDSLLTATSPDDLDAQDAAGSTALTFVLRRAVIVLEHLDRLLSAGADPTIPGTDGTTPLMIAVTRNSFASILALLNYEADPCSRAANGMTALHYFVSAPHGTSHATLRNLVHAVGPSAIDATDSQGCTPLMTAIRYECEGCVRILIAAGANVHVPFSDELGGETLMQWAWRTGDGTLYALLSEAIGVNARFGFGGAVDDVEEDAGDQCGGHEHSGVRM